MTRNLKRWWSNENILTTSALVFTIMFIVLFCFSLYSGNNTFFFFALASLAITLVLLMRFNTLIKQENEQEEMLETFR